jgi:hypothetical protein
MRIAMKKYITYISTILIMLLPVLLLSQADTGKSQEKSVRLDKVMTNIPSQAQYSDKFTIKNLYFNKRIDLGGKGEVLEVEFILENLIDEPQDLYIFTIATYEKTEKTKSSFERPIPARERIRTFITYPDDISNFTYPVTDEKGNVKKDENGKDMVKLVKFPKNPKAGVDPKTGKTYHLVNRLVLYTTHVSPYRNNYYFYNNVAVLIFDSEGKPAFRQLYTIKGKRGR